MTVLGQVRHTALHLAMACFAITLVACATNAGTATDAGRSGTPDGGPCSVEHAIDRANSAVCCHGNWVHVDDLFGFPHDAGPPVGGYPDASLFCSPSGASGCVGGLVAECTGGTWRTSDVFCAVPWCS